VEILFVGVGEACDTTNGNTSALVTTAGGSRILLDCGFTVPHQYFTTAVDPAAPDFIWISHFHGDHFFGLPLLFLRLWQMGRTNPLIIVSQSGVEEKVRNCLEMSFPGFEEKLSFELSFQELSPDRKIVIGDVRLSAAVTRHSQYNLGLLLDDGSKRLYYSGDGRPTDDVRQLIHGCDLLIHEAFKYVDEFPYHGSFISCLELAEQAKVKKTALVHLDRDFRASDMERIQAMLQERNDVLLPVAGDLLIL
jgi:ribonuclease BN (tRNA processing enzyme)